MGNHARLIPVTITFNLFHSEYILPCKLGCKSLGLVPTEISCHFLSLKGFYFWQVFSIWPLSNHDLLLLVVAWLLIFTGI